jgi:hypothetical protein
VVGGAPELVIQYEELNLGGVLAEGGSGVVRSWVEENPKLMDALLSSLILLDWTGQWGVLGRIPHSGKPYCLF